MGTIISTPVTLDNLNKVYRDLRHRIGSIGNIYHPQGTLTWASIIALTGVNQGDVYNVKIDDNNPGPYIFDSEGKKTDELDQRFYNGVNIYCKSSITENAIEESQWEAYWEVLEGMLEEATPSTAGVVKLGSTNQDTKAGDVTNETLLINRGLKLSEPTGDHDGEKYTNHQAYVDIPVASKETYGVITNQDQAFAGPKTFNGDLTVYGNLSLKQDAEVSMNSLTANTIILGNSVKITAADGIISFTAI